MTITTNNVSSPLRYGSNVKLVAQREFGRSPEEVARKLHLTRDMAARLAVEDVLMGHHGCVNRLAWNQEGDRLASASDDRNVILWHYPDSGRLPVLVETDHQANIFGVRVLPETGDGMIVTGAMDFLVQLHTLDARGAPPCGGRRRSASGSFASAPCSTKSFACHRSRVKDVEVQPHNPHMFWSASEDGTVRQFDTRCGDQGRFQSPNVLLGVRGRSRKVPLKGLSLNKSRPYQLAVACGDPFVRIFDMRKLSARAPCEDMFAQPLLQLAPPHLHRASSLQAACYATCAKFSSRGDKVVATYHGDHAYSFDITGDPASYGTSFVQHSACAALAGAGARPSREWERWKFKGNTAMFEKDFHGAILNYSAGLRTEPTSTALLIGRASAYMQRQWAGDAAYAVLDCEAAMSLNPDLPRAHILRAQALLSLRHLRLAMRAVNTIAAKFPEQHQEEVEKLRSSISDEEKARKTLHEQRIAMRSHTRQRRMRSTPGLQHESGLGTGAEAEAEGLSPFTSGHASASSVAGHLNGEEAARGSVLMGLDTDESDAEPTESDSDDADMVGERELEGASTSGCDGSGNKDEPLPSIWELSQGTRRLMMRYVGHCNFQTDIKEASFLGQNDELVACGSDDGRIYIFDAESGEPVRVLEADEDVANCVQCHPTLAVLATSGIESSVKLWSPGSTYDRTDVSRLVRLNQARMRDGPQWYPRGVFHTAMQTHVLQTLTENPYLIPELRSLLSTQVGTGRSGLDIARNLSSGRSSTGNGDGAEQGRLSSASDRSGDGGGPPMTIEDIQSELFEEEGSVVRCRMS